MKHLPAFFVLLVLPIVSSCGYGRKQGGIESGRIDYNITYLNEDLDKKTLEVLPRKMKLVFNDKEAVNNIEGFLGFYRLEAFTNFHTRKCSTLLKVFDKHYLFTGKKDEMMCCFDAMKGMEIRETGETKQIAGLQCKKAHVILPSSHSTFDIYYTGEIRLKHPNATNPYYMVEGVLMEFELRLLYLNMRFTAEKFQPMADKSDESSVPENTRNISRDQMTEILGRLME